MAGDPKISAVLAVLEIPVVLIGPVARPDDSVVVQIDDADVATRMWPPLATIRQSPVDENAQSEITQFIIDVVVNIDRLIKKTRLQMA